MIMKYRVGMHCVAWLTVEVEAEDEDAAISAAWEQGLPDLMTLDHRYPNTDEGWEPDTEPISSSGFKIEEVVVQIG